MADLPIANFDHSLAINLSPPFLFQSAFGNWQSAMTKAPRQTTRGLPKPFR
jgi:hypothetical protein